MSMYAFGQPAAITGMRAVTERARKMAGVMSPSFKCVCCRQIKRAEGRKQAVKGTNKFGYKCADCAAAGSAGVTA